MTLRPDGTADCAKCGLPMFPVEGSDRAITLECANRHRVDVPPPVDRAMKAIVENWIARKRAQLHQQHERWEDDRDAE